jgi:ribosome-binding factor A
LIQAIILRDRRASFLAAMVVYWSCHVKHRKRSPGSRRDLCARLYEDDGLNPARDSKIERPTSTDRKTRQLCSQVARAVDLSLSGECRDALLQQLRVATVEPAPDTKRLLVTLAPVFSDESLDVARTMARLALVHGVLKREVAAAISRKRTPELTFRIVASAEGDS